MVDLSTSYLGLTLKNPIVASASPLSERIDTLRQLVDAGASAVVLHSLFEEQITLESHQLDHHLSHAAESFAEALTYFPDLTEYNLGPESYIEHVRQAKKAVDVPVIGSLNGVSSGGWIEYAKKIQDAGADALEINEYYIPTDPKTDSAEVERMYADLVKDLRRTVQIPIAVKISPYFSALSNMAAKLEDAGADALVLFNRFYQPDFDLENLEVVPNLTLSSSHELRLRLRWVAILYGHTDADLAVTGGVHTTEDVLKCMMAGAKVAMLASALLQNGTIHITRLLNTLTEWMEEKQYESIQEMQGSMSQQAVAEPDAFERANYLKVLGSYHKTSPLTP